jgi:hypothetical protein
MRAAVPSEITATRLQVDHPAEGRGNGFKRMRVTDESPVGAKPRPEGAVVTTKRSGVVTTATRQ